MLACEPNCGDKVHEYVCALVGHGHLSGVLTVITLVVSSISSLSGTVYKMGNEARGNGTAQGKYASIGIDQSKLAMGNLAGGVKGSPPTGDLSLAIMEE